MKNPSLILILLVPLLLFVTSTSINAQDDPAFDTRERVTENPDFNREKTREVRETIEQKRIEVKERVEENKLKASERLSTVMNEHGDRLANRFSIYIERLNTLINKLKIRLQAMQADGLDVEDAISKVDEAESSLEMAQNYADEAISIFSGMTSENYSRDEALRAKELINSAREELRNTHQLLKEAVKLAREAQGGAE